MSAPISVENYPAIAEPSPRPVLPVSDRAWYEEDALTLLASQQRPDHSMMSKSGAEVRMNADLYPSRFYINSHSRRRDSRRRNQMYESTAPTDEAFVRTSSTPRIEQQHSTVSVKSIAPLINPADHYLEGAKLENIPTPKCEMIDCRGPFPNDGNILFEAPRKGRSYSCYQAFVPLNSCVKDRGYPVGMVCTICCKCSIEFVREMKRSKGYQELGN
ncbi:hypothetical protein AB6A40_010378 [Gnathostoma spinigerum]|uniref:Uncharacterized protein n=1 Tax=Gnathostoma spinigerum TaxID=75299 RepID=A0ABD6EUM4_9BILA